MKSSPAAFIVVLALALVIAISLIPSKGYSLIVGYPQKPLAQLGPFATEQSCTSAGRRLAELGGGTITEKDREDFAEMTICVSSR